MDLKQESKQPVEPDETYACEKCSAQFRPEEESYTSVKNEAGETEFVWCERCGEVQSLKDFLRHGPLIESQRQKARVRLAELGVHKCSCGEIFDLALGEGARLEQDENALVCRDCFHDWFAPKAGVSP